MTESAGLASSWTDSYRVAPGSGPALANRPTSDTGGLDKDEAKRRLEKLHERLGELQEVLYAGGRRGLLVVLQAMDTGGKDSTIRKVFGPLNPQGVRVWNFKAPTDNELAHDFLWRVHRRVPGRGYIGVFNRSHYEDIVVARVKGLVPEATWKARYDHINAFERLLHEEGVTVLKFFLHISKHYQRERLERRLRLPEKHWKFAPQDLKERARWGDYQAAYDAALARCSTEHAPWYVVPAEKRWFRNLLVATVITNALESMDLRYPQARFDPASITID